jgi:hypothetical protein
MAITNFIPKLWAAAILVPYRKALIYGQSTLATTRYTGEITGRGSSVQITTLADVTIKPYDKLTDIEIEQLEDGKIDLLIDQGDYFAFYVNDVDKAQAAGDFQGPATQSAGYGLRDKIDGFIANLLVKGVADSNKDGRVKVVYGGGKAGAGQMLGYDVLVSLQEKLNEHSVPLEGRWVVIPPKFLSAIENDPRFSNVDSSGSDETLRNGIVKRALGFDILVSNNVPKVGGASAAKDDLVLLAGVSDAYAFADSITETEAIRAEKRFADIVRGLNVYGAAVTRPTALASATASFEASTYSAPAAV